MNETTKSRWVRRVKSWHGAPTDGLPWAADVRTFDIPETIVMDGDENQSTGRPWGYTIEELCRLCDVSPEVAERAIANLLRRGLIEECQEQTDA